MCVKSQGVGVKKSCEELVQRVNEMLSRVYKDSPPMLVRMPNTLAYGKPEYLNWSFFFARVFSLRLDYVMVLIKHTCAMSMMLGVNNNG